MYLKTKKYWLNATHKQNQWKTIWMVKLFYTNAGELPYQAQNRQLMRDKKTKYRKILFKYGFKWKNTEDQLQIL